MWFALRLYVNHVREVFIINHIVINLFEGAQQVSAIFENEFL
jgi:hypothetical protein